MCTEGPHFESSKCKRVRLVGYALALFRDHWVVMIFKSPKFFVYVTVDIMFVVVKFPVIICNNDVKIV